KKAEVQKPVPRKSSAQALDDYMSTLLPVQDDGNAESAELAVLDVMPDKPVQSNKYQAHNVFWWDVIDIEDNPFQPRLRMEQEELQELEDDVNEHGQLQAGLARPHPDDPDQAYPRRIQLAIAHRRKEVVKRGANAGTGLPNAHLYIGKLKVEVRPLTNNQMLDYANAENVKRAGFSVFDRAYYLQMKQKLHPDSTEDNLVTVEKLVDDLKLPIKARFVRNLLDTLTLPQWIIDRLPYINLGDEEHVIRPNEKHCRALLQLKPAGTKGQQKTPTAKQKKLFQQIETEKISGNEAMRRADAMLSESAGTTATSGSAAQAGSANGETSGAGQAGTSSPDTSSTPAKTEKPLTPKQQLKRDALDDTAAALKGAREVVSLSGRAASRIAGQKLDVDTKREVQLSAQEMETLGRNLVENAAKIREALN
ncbi:MAG TPA: hypothetical protein VF719_08840, partial [Abditibacteriaceae bacterium]